MFVTDIKMGFALALNSHAGLSAASTEEDTNRYVEVAKLQKSVLSGSSQLSATIISQY